MILQAFKEKSNQKFVSRLLNSRTTNVQQKRMESVGIVIDAAEFSQGDAFKDFIHDLGVPLPKIQMIVFVENEKKNDRLWGNYFSKKDFGWRGNVKHVELQTFLDTEFDALIGFYKNQALELKIVAAASKANFKIGLSGVDDRLFDLILDVEPNNFDIFKTELRKYLTILNKI